MNEWICLERSSVTWGECLQETERSASEVDRIGMHVCLESVGDDFPTAKDDYSHSPYEVKDNC